MKYFLLLLIFYPFISLSQKLEIEINKHYESGYTLIPCDEEGLAFVYKTGEKYKNDMLWEIHLFDTTFVVRWQQKYPFSQNVILRNAFYQMGHIYLIFKKQHILDSELLLLDFSTQTGIVLKYDIHLPLQNILIDYFTVVGGNIFFFGKEQNKTLGIRSKPLVLLYHTTTNKVVVLPGFYQEQTKILDVKIDAFVKNISILFFENVNNKEVMSLKIMSSEGEELFQHKVDFSPNKRALHALLGEVYNGNIHIAGIFTKYYGPLSEGIFIAKINQQNEQTIQYFPYTKIPDLFSYLPVKKYMKIRKKILKGENVPLKDIVQVDNMVLLNDTFRILGHIYKQEKQSNTYYSYRNSNTGDTFFPKYTAYDAGVYEMMLDRNAAIAKSNPEKYEALIQKAPRSPLQGDNYTLINGYTPQNIANKTSDISSSKQELKNFYLIFDTDKQSIYEIDNPHKNSFWNKMQQKKLSSKSLESLVMYQNIYWYRKYGFIYHEKLKEEDTLGHVKQKKIIAIYKRPF